MQRKEFRALSDAGINGKWRHKSVAWSSPTLHAYFFVGGFPLHESGEYPTVDNALRYALQCRG